MNYHLSKDAEQDIADIYVYSFQQFGEAKAESYFDILPSLKEGDSYGS